MGNNFWQNFARSCGEIAKLYLLVMAGTARP
jgi:hypothetical protein